MHRLGLIRLAAAAGIALGSILASPAGVFGKEGVEATLRTPVPVNAAQGQRISLAWTLKYMDENGKRQPFNAEGVFVRLLSRTNREPTIGYATGGAHADGDYAAEVIVPEGRIGGIQIGLPGLVFPLADAGHQFARSGALLSEADPYGGYPVPVLVIGLMAAAALALGLELRRRSRGRTRLQDLDQAFHA